MKSLIALAVGAFGVVAASPAFAQDTAVPPGYIQGGPAYTGSSFASGPFGILALPFQVAAAPFQMFVPANGALGPTNSTLVPANPDCGVWHDWNGRYTSVCGL
jgi:hypothetical protein